MNKIRVRISIKYNNPIVFEAIDSDAERIINIINNNYEVISVYKTILDSFKLR